jgi:hypothetical protein
MEARERSVKKPYSRPEVRVEPLHVGVYGSYGGDDQIPTTPVLPVPGHGTDESIHRD